MTEFPRANTNGTRMGSGVELAGIGGCAKAGFRNCGMRTPGVNSQWNGVTAGETAGIPVREGAQYGEGVAWGGLLENPYEMPKSSRRPRHDDSQRDGFKLEEGSAHVPDVEHGSNRD